jgi:hypothetical protein
MASPPEERWTQASAQADLVLHLEAELEQKILRYKLAIRECLHLEWSWQVEPGRGRMECTIFAHIHIGTSAICVQNERHLYWKETDSITVMKNEAEFATEAHDLLLKNGPSRIDHQTYKHRMASILASPQVARKRRYIRLDLGTVEPNLTAEANPFQGTQMVELLNPQNSEPA